MSISNLFLLIEGRYCVSITNVFLLIEGRCCVSITNLFLLIEGRCCVSVTYVFFEIWTTLNIYAHRILSTRAMVLYD